MNYKNGAVGSDIARSKRQFLARFLANKIIEILNLNTPSLLKTEFYQQWRPECYINSAAGKIKMVGGHGRLIWRAKTFYQEEPQTVQWLDALKKTDIFWDIGANVGIYSLYAAFTKNCKVVAFEPEPNNFSILVENVHKNKLKDRITLCNLPVSSKKLFSSLELNDITKGGAFNKFHEKKLPCVKTQKLTIKTFGLSIDSILKDKEFPAPSFLKIDVDGNEYEILQGAQKLLASAKLKTILIEIDEASLHYKKILNILEKNNFAIHKKRSNWESRENKSMMHLSPGVNYIFNKSDKKN